jgi:hypothetical protein
MGLKQFYLILGGILTVGAAYLLYRRLTGLDNASTDFSIIFCSIIGILCLVMYGYVDKLKGK